MGGDHGPSVVVPGIRSYLRAHDGEGVRFLLHGDEAQIATHLARCGVREGSVALRLGGGQGGLRCCDFDKTGRLVATGGDGGVLSVWDVKRRRVVRSVEDHASAIGAARFDASSATLASGNAAGEVLLHRVRSKQLLALLVDGDEYDARPAVSALEFSPLKPQVLGASYRDGSLRLWDAGRGDLLASLGGGGAGGGGDARTGLAFSPVNAKFVAATGADGITAFWDADAGARVKSLDAEGSRATCVAFATEGVVVLGRVCRNRVQRHFNIA